MTRIAYWAATLFVALSALVAGTMDILHASPLFDEVLRLGYPPHFASLLGVWKVLGGLTLLVPRWPLVKEWAYAGMVIDYSGAVTAHASTGDGMGAIVPVLFSAALLVVSWYLRPPSRRLVFSSAA